MRASRKKVVRMTELSLLTAIVLVLQLLGIGIKLPFLATPVSLVLIPIVIGATVLGPKAGAWLGFVFGMEVYLVCGVMGTDLFTTVLFQDHPIITLLLCVLKSTLAGFLCGVVYDALKDKNKLLAVGVAAAIAPIVNTLVFILGCLFMTDTLNANFVAEDSNVIYFLVIGCAGLNFVFEFLINVVFTPALNRLIAILNKRLGAEG